MNDEREYILKSLDGNQEAFAMIIQKYQTPLLNYVGRMVKDKETALDLLQAVSYTHLRAHET